jgi:hypothetical protein
MTVKEWLEGYEATDLTFEQLWRAFYDAFQVGCPCDTCFQDYFKGVKDGCFVHQCDPGCLQMADYLTFDGAETPTEYCNCPCHG